MRYASSRSWLLVPVLAALAACSDSGPRTFDEDGILADLNAATAAVSSPATASFGALGPQISSAIGGMDVVVDIPASIFTDPRAVMAREELRARLFARERVQADLPAAALGKTFVYDTLQGRFVVSERTGAPAHGARFILYAVSPLTHELVMPLVESGYVDITRTLSDESITARVEVIAGTQALTKVLDYSAALSGTILAPQVVVAGFARNQTDSLTFNLRSSLSLAASTIGIDWRAAVPTRGLSSRVQQTLTGGETPAVTINGVLNSISGKVRVAGTIQQADGGTLVVEVNDALFASIAVSGFDDETPTILNAQGQPLTPQQVDIMEDILDWFEDAMDFYEDLLDPVEYLLDLVTPL